MTLSEIAESLDATILSQKIDGDIDIKSAKAADLMSDVLSFANSGSLLITGLTNNQVIRTCEIAGIAAIVFVRGKKPPDEVVTLGKNCHIPILATRLSMFEACGILYKNGLKATPVE